MTVTAISSADPSKQNSVAVTVTSNFTLQVSAPATVAANASVAIVATMTAVPGSNPKTGLSWNLSGTGCSGTRCGILSVTTTQSTGGNSVADTATYTAPASTPQPNTVTVTVTPQADPTKMAQASIAIQSGASLAISPFTATLAANHRITLAVTENQVNGALNWTVNGVPGGNSTFGELCAVGSSPCRASAAVPHFKCDFVAPGAIPSPNPVSVMATSANNPQVFASSQITLLNHILVSVLPNNVSVPPLGTQGFTATFSEQRIKM